MRKAIESILSEAATLGFTRLERHAVAEVFRTADLEYRERNPLRSDWFDRKTREVYDMAARFHAEAVARQYMKEEIDKWHRRGYKSQGDGDCPHD